MRTSSIICAAVVVLSGLLAACGPNGGTGGELAQSVYAPQQPTQVAALCREVDGRADHTCTPGLAAHRPAVTADAPRYLHTLCQPKGVEPRWDTTVRPPTATTNKWKIAVMNAYGFRNVALKDVEGDHIISLILDGDDGSTKGPEGLPANFYPEMWNGPTGAHVKDQEEDLLHRQVCSGALTLEQAQAKIVADWVH